MIDTHVCWLPCHFLPALGLVLQVVFGMLGGMIAGALLGCTKVFNNKYKRLIGIYGAGKCSEKAIRLQHRVVCFSIVNVIIHVHAESSRPWA